MNFHLRCREIPVKWKGAGIRWTWRLTGIPRCNNIKTEWRGTGKTTQGLRAEVHGGEGPMVTPSPPHLTPGLSCVTLTPLTGLNYPESLAANMSHALALFKWHSSATESLDVHSSIFLVHTAPGETDLVMKFHGMKIKSWLNLNVALRCNK